MPTVALARHAMATRFEILLHGPNEVSLRAAGEEALREIDRLEAQLSLYRPTSEIARLNARAGRQPVRVTPELFALLEHIQLLNKQTQGAFDVTIAPLMRCWSFMGAQGAFPDKEALIQARDKVGMSRILLNPDDCSVQFDREGVMIDLGAIGKGYAIEQASQLLQEAGVEHALIHGGTSTIQAMGSQPDGRPWTVAVESPPTQPGAPPTLLAAVPLQHHALSVSAVWGKSFESGGKTYGHVLDPRTGQPSQSAALAAVVSVSATEADALSTALLVRGFEGLGEFKLEWPDFRGLVLGPPEPGYHSVGIELMPQGQQLK